VEFVVEICRCVYRKFDGVRGRYVSGLDFNYEGVSCDVGLERRLTTVVERSAIAVVSGT
jgi:hypothetical protein